MRFLSQFKSAVFVSGALFSAVCFSATDQVNHQVNLQAGEELYKVCAVCHGKDALGNPTVKAPKLAGQSVAYMERQLQNFKSGLRGKAKGDRYGSQMQPMALGLDEADIKNVAAYVASLPKPNDTQSKAKVKGDAEKGKQLYQTCVTCHGADGAGNDTLGAPRLAGQEDWYLLGQLQNYKKGARGAQAGDTFGSQMRAMATTLPDKQSEKDVIAYIYSLSE